jgi:hypothetical protein
MEVLFLILIGSLLFAGLSNQSTNKASGRPRNNGYSVRKDPYSDQTHIAQGSWLERKKAGFATKRAKAQAFDRLIAWARNEAASRGLNFNEITGDNDYQKAKRVFHNSHKWGCLRRATLNRFKVCLRCGTDKSLQADHVIPMVRRPDLYDSESNLQTLCARCNNWKKVKAIDYRFSHHRTIAVASTATVKRPKPNRETSKRDRRKASVTRPSVYLAYVDPTKVPRPTPSNAEERRARNKEIAHEIVEAARAKQAARQRLLVRKNVKRDGD